MAMIKLLIVKERVGGCLVLGRMGGMVLGRIILGRMVWVSE